MAGIDGGYLTFNLKGRNDPDSVEYDDTELQPTTNEGAMVNTAANYDDNTYEEPHGKKSFPFITHFPGNWVGTLGNLQITGINGNNFNSKSAKHD